MSKPESRLQRRIRKALRAEFGGFWYKMWGGPYMPRGIPDLCGVVSTPYQPRTNPGVKGRAVYVEVKQEDGEVSAVQVERMRELADAGAAVCVATSVDEALERVAELLAHPRSRFCLSCLSVLAPRLWAEPCPGPTLVHVL